MPSSPEIPADVLRAETSGRTVSVRLAADAYPLGAVYGAAYVFLDRCWVLLDKPTPGELRISLTWRGEPPPAALDGVAAELAEELVSCAWRDAIARDTQGQITDATAKAHSGAEGTAPSLDDLSQYDFGGDAMADPLGIAMSWEEKHKKQPAAAAAPATDEKKDT